MAIPCRELERLDVRLSGVGEDEEIAIDDMLQHRLRGKDK